MKEFSNFEDQVKNASGLVLLDFYADWCGPCRQMVPILEALDAEIDYLTIYKVDTDKHVNFASVNEIRALPTFVLFKGGIAIDRKVGSLSRSELKSWIEKNKN